MPTAIVRYLIPLSLAIAHGSSYATSPQEQVQLSLIQRQLDTIERLATQADAASRSEPNDRYRFDYLRLFKDIQRIRQGVQGYLAPSRAQPRDPDEIVGDYRLDAPSTEPWP